MRKFSLDSSNLNLHERTCYCSSPAIGYPASIELFRQDDKPRSVFYIERGLVKLVRCEDNGDSIIVGLRRAGWHLGLPAVLLNRLYAATAVTLTPCKLRCIPLEEFLDVLKKNNTFPNTLNRMLSAEVYQTMQRMSCLTRVFSQKCLMEFFWEIYSIQQNEETGGNKPARLKLPLKQWELGQLFAVTPEYVSRMLKKLEVEGIIRRDKGWVVIADPQKLRECIGS